MFTSHSTLYTCTPYACNELRSSCLRPEFRLPNGLSNNKFNLFTIYLSILQCTNYNYIAIVFPLFPILDIHNRLFRPMCHRNSWYMASDGHRAHTGDMQVYHHYHRRHPGDNIFPTLFHGSAKRKCSFYLQHHGHRVNCRCNHNFDFIISIFIFCF